MPTLLQINTTLNYGSTGRIAENIGRLAKAAGWRSVIAHGPRMTNPSQLETFQTNSPFDEKIHGLFFSLLRDRHGLGSRKATERFVEKIKRDVKPDVIHLHNIHGYYVNYEVLFSFLKSVDVPVVCTMHDCWLFTGHCANFDAIGCEKWQSQCERCPQTRSYPSSLFVDNSRSNFLLKKELLTSIKERLMLIPVSDYLAGFVGNSFLKDCNIRVIHNGIDLDAFYPQNSTGSTGPKTILGVAAPWTEKKGLYDFYKLRKLLSAEYSIKLIGLTKKQIKELPEGITGIERTQSVSELAHHYSDAMVFVNPTYEDNYPTTNLEAIACGTPVVTYRTGGSPESVAQSTGIVVEQGNVDGLMTAIKEISEWNPDRTREGCVGYAKENFDRNKCFKKYIDLYDSLL